MQFADLHLHSSYSRATSKNITLGEMARNARIKGLDILGTGDFTHPIWIKDLKKQLVDEDGIYDYDNIKFILTGEISLVYTQGGKGRRIHHVLLAPDFAAVDQINTFLDKKGRRDYDGRPIFGFSSIELVDTMMSISKDIMVIPAHCLTPWFGVFGSMSGFNSLEECFQDKTKYIHAVETGLSADPEMLWRISSLDDIALVSFSDAHSLHPHRLGREATVFDLKEVNYKNIVNAIKSKEILFTVETSPSYGKYHFDGHRNCNFSCTPDESKNLRNICPKCGTKLTIGVLHRVEELADRPEGFCPKAAPDFKSLLPLMELIALHYGQAVFSKKVLSLHNSFIERFGNEFNILIDVDRKDLEKIDEKLADLVIKNREGKIHVVPGYDGVYGKPMLSVKPVENVPIKKRQKSISDF